jgi:uncharacterized protein (TIGR02284 family)
MTQNSVAPRTNKEVLDMLIDISRYGARFYDQSAERVEERSLKMLFKRMADAKHALVRNFSTSDGAGRQTLAAAGSLLGEYQRQYAELRTRIGAGNAYVSALAHLETQLLKAIDKQVFEPGTSLGQRTAAALCLPPLQAAVDELNERKDGVQRKAA